MQSVAQYLKDTVRRNRIGQPCVVSGKVSPGAEEGSQAEPVSAQWILLEKDQTGDASGNCPALSFLVEPFLNIVLFGCAGFSLLCGLFSGCGEGGSAAP